MSIDVRLSTTAVPRFPDRCVGCGADAPGRVVTVWAWRVPIWVLLTGIALFFTRARRTKVPACRRCGWRLRFRRLFETGAMIALVVAGMGLAARFSPQAPKLLRKVALIVGAVVGLLPYVYWVATHPAAFDVTLERDAVVYEFRDPLYAMEFAGLNEADVAPVA
jgi:hypothetical protein